MRILSLLACAVTALVLTAAASSRTAPAAVGVHASDYGRILFDGRGYVLYAFTRDARGRSACYGDCAAAWPPYLVASRPQARAGAHASLLGTTRRRNGKLQATYDGRPLYYYRGDRSPGQILCQNVLEYGGLWLVVAPDGHVVR